MGHESWSRQEYWKSQAQRIRDSDLPMEDALAAAGRLHERSMERFNERRKVEWRLAFALWAGLVLGANALSNLGVCPETWVYVVLGVLLAGVVVAHLLFAWLYADRGARDNRDVGIDLESTIRAVLGIDFTEPKSYLRLAAHYWQVGVTLVLAAFLLGIAWWGPDACALAHG